MGIDATLAYHLATTSRTFNVRGSLCTFGVQTIRSDNHQIDLALASGGIEGQRDMPLYARLGFDRVESLDVSDFEGCTQIVDLNTPGVPQHLSGQFDAVYNGGTLEHIFDTRAALRNVFELLNAAGGVVIHVGPANGWLDHGFYQFSPTLLVDYYLANRFEILEARLIHLQDETGAAKVYPYAPGVLDDRLAQLSGRLLFYMTFRKQLASTWEAIPQQRYYTDIYGDPANGPTTPCLRYVPPYRLQDGVRVDRAQPLQALPAPTRADGFEWVVHVPDIADSSDGMNRRQSRLVLFEDGVAIGPPHAQHADIRTRGAGRYSHWEEWLRLSPTRNDDARAHVYAYAMATDQL